MITSTTGKGVGAGQRALAAGWAAAERGDVGSAITAYRTALRYDPGLAPAHFNLGQLLRQQGDYQGAAACFEGAARLRPNAADAWLNLGAMLERVERHRDALAAYERAAACNPDNPDPLYNRGNALLALGDYAAAASAFRSVIERSPDHVEAQWNLATALLAMGQFDEGWKQYQWRWKRKGVAPETRFPWPLWHGEPVAEKRILVWREQGLGDELLFATCLRELVAAGASVTLAATPRLVSLFERAFPSITVVPDGEFGPGPFDFHAPIGALPQFLRRTLDHFPTASKFLVPDSARATRWSTRLDKLEAGARIGIAWRSGLLTEDRSRHYSSLDEWGPLFAIPNVRWVNLQYDDCNAELTAAEKKFGVTIHRWRNEDLRNDLESVVGLLWNLDYVITAPNAVSSLAGGAGVPTLELDSGGDWTVHGQERSPWFPTIRVIRRHPSDGGFGPAIARTAARLSEAVQGLVPV